MISSPCETQRGYHLCSRVSELRCERHQLTPPAPTLIAASLRALAGRNLVDFVAGICILALVRGLTPVLAFFSTTKIVPSSLILICPFLLTDSWMVSVNDLNRFRHLLGDVGLFRYAEMISALVIGHPP